MMRPLEALDSHALSAAIGWLGLGNPAEAKAELAHISPSNREHPDVLEAQWLICAGDKEWDEALTIARALMAKAPERASGWLNQAYALRRVADGGVKQAWKALLPAFDKFPKEPVISYNLSCYACQMKQMEAARVWFKRASFLGGKEKYKRMALEDPDLEPLWEEIRESQESSEGLDNPGL
jgi:predicted Zn-dependent protease